MKKLGLGVKFALLWILIGFVLLLIINIIASNNIINLQPVMSKVVSLYVKLGVVVSIGAYVLKMWSMWRETKLSE